MVRSAALGGEAVTRLDGAGAKRETIIEVDGLLRVVQGGFPQLNWGHTDPLGQTEITQLSGDKKAVFDLLGNYIPFQQTPSATPPGPFSPKGYTFGTAWGFQRDSSTATCTMDGVPADCPSMARMVRNGSVEQCLGNYCGARVIDGEFLPMLRNPPTGLLGYRRFVSEDGLDTNPEEVGDDPVRVRTHPGRWVVGRTACPDIAWLGGGLPEPQKPDIEGCVTPNKIINEPKLRAFFEELWGRTRRSGEENGAALILEPGASMLYGNALPEGRHLKWGSGSIPAMPDFAPDTRKVLAQFRRDGHRVALFGTFHTHPDYPSGRSREGNPSSADIQTQDDFGNPLGIIRTSNGYSFYLDGRRFDPSDPRANECLGYNGSEVR